MFASLHGRHPATGLRPSHRARVGGGRTVGTMALHIGGHVEQTDPIPEAVERKATLSQFFLGDPQSYKGPVVSYAGGAAGLKADAEAAGIDLYVHSPYPINVASTNNRIRIPGRKLLQQHLHAAAEIGAKGVIVHGGHVLKDDDPTVGLRQLAQVHRRPGHAGPAADREHRRRRQRHGPAARADRPALGGDRPAEGGDTVGFCLDTCHAHAGGNELAAWSRRCGPSPGGSTSCTPTTPGTTFDSGADRHTNFGSGHIEGDDLAAVVREAGAPVVCETPGGAEGQGGRHRLAARASRRIGEPAHGPPTGASSGRSARRGLRVVDAVRRWAAPAPQWPMSSSAASPTQNQSQPLSPPACQRMTYMSVAKGRKIRPSSGQIHESKAASTMLGLATQTMNRASRGKIPANSTNRHPMGGSCRSRSGAGRGGPGRRVVQGQ